MLETAREITLQNAPATKISKLAQFFSNKLLKKG
jgi:hypothetical protein